MIFLFASATSIFPSSQGQLNLIQFDYHEQLCLDSMITITDVTFHFILKTHDSIGSVSCDHFWRNQCRHAQISICISWSQSNSRVWVELQFDAWITYPQSHLIRPVHAINLIRRVISHGFRGVHWVDLLGHACFVFSYRLNTILVFKLIRSKRLR